MLISVSTIQKREKNALQTSMFMFWMFLSSPSACDHNFFNSLTEEYWFCKHPVCIISFHTIIRQSKYALRLKIVLKNRWVVICLNFNDHNYKWIDVSDHFLMCKEYTIRKKLLSRYFPPKASSSYGIQPVWRGN